MTLILLNNTNNNDLNVHNIQYIIYIYIDTLKLLNDNSNNIDLYVNIYRH